MWQAIGAVGGKIMDMLGGNADRNAQLQAAKNQVQWRTEDAKKAGIHPLAAIGMNPVSISPTTIGDSGALASAGQSIDRAIDAGSTKTQRLDNASARLLDAQITGAELDNDIKRAEYASMVSRTSGAHAIPPVPSISVNGAYRTVDHPVFGKVTRPGMAAGDLQQEVGELGDWMEGANYFNEWSRTHTGIPVLGRSEMDFLRDLGHALGWATGRR